MQAHLSHPEETPEGPMSIFFKLVVIAFIVLNIYWMFSKKATVTKIPDITTRMRRKFQFAHGEVLPQLTMNERKDMLQVLQNTIINAELFKNPERVKNGISSKKVVNGPIKRVHFNI